MKLSGRWLSVFWITVTLLWMPHPAAALVAPDGAGQCKTPKIAALPLVGNFSPSSEKQTGEWADADESERHHDPMLPGRKPNPVSPICAVVSRCIVGDQIETWTPAVARPLSRGPPAQA